MSDYILLGLLSFMSILAIFSAYDRITYDWGKSHHRTLRTRLEDTTKSNSCCVAKTKVCMACEMGITVAYFCEKIAPLHKEDFGCDETKHATALSRTSKITTKAHIKKKKPIIAICAATRSVSNWKTVKDTSLQTLMIPSIEKTVSVIDRNKYKFHLYLAADHDDNFWLKNKHKIQVPKWLSLHFYFFEGPEHKIPFNKMMRQAYEDGAEYMVRINDDSQFITSDWVPEAVKTLASYVPPNVGMVGPNCKEGNTGIMTHDMVHRTHLKIFPHYYPDVFSAWYIDDWITHVYGKKRSTKIMNWIVKHHIHKHGTRYSVNRSEQKMLQGEISKGKLVVEKWLKSKKVFSRQFKIHVLTMNRAKSLKRLLDSLENSDYDNDKVELYIHIDKSSDNSGCIKVGKSFKFSHGKIILNVAKKNNGLRNAWLKAWRPKAMERAIILEDDIEVSPKWYLWLKKSWEAYGERNDIAGISLQRQTLVPQKPNKEKEIVNNHEPFLYRLVGSIGFSPHWQQWQSFLKWVDSVNVDTVNVKTPDLITSDWFDTLDRRHIWTQYFIWFCNEHDLYTLYLNLPYKKTFASHMREKGEHFKGSEGRDFAVASEVVLKFPKNLQKYGWDGQKMDSPVCVIGKPPWSGVGVDLDTFLKIYSGRPGGNNDGGGALFHYYALYKVVKALNPDYIIESGAHAGVGTWFLRASSNTAKIIVVSPKTPWIYKDPNGMYFTDEKFKDFKDIDWSFLNPSKTLVFFDDHQSGFRRMQESHERGFSHLVFDDNYIPGHGDNFSGKKVCNDKIYSLLNVPFVEEDNFGKISEKLSSTEFYQHHKIFHDIVDVYAEFPPVWSGPNRFGIPQPVYEKITMLPILSKAEAQTLGLDMNYETKRYTHILYVKLKGSEGPKTKLVTDGSEKGEHFTRTEGRDFALATQVTMNFPIDLVKYGWDGQKMAKPIIFTVVSSSMLEMAMNWWHYLSPYSESISVHITGLSKSICQYFRGKDVICTDAEITEEDLTEDVTYKTRGYLQNVKRKLYEYSRFLESVPMGTTVLFSDVDVVFLSNPFDAINTDKFKLGFSGGSKGKNCHALLNTGVFFVVKTVQATALFKHAIENLNIGSSYDGTDQGAIQAAVNKLKLKYFQLPCDTFVNGNGLFTIKTLKTPVSIHMNWIVKSSVKKQCFEACRLWMGDAKEFRKADATLLPSGQISRCSKKTKLNSRTVHLPMLKIKKKPHGH